MEAKTESQLKTKRKRSKRPNRIRAHSNPLSIGNIEFNSSPEDVQWDALYPAFFGERATKPQTSVTMADVGSGFGGLLVALGPLFPDKLVLGLEIRSQVVEIFEERLDSLRNGDRSAILSPVEKVHQAKRQKLDDTAADVQPKSPLETLLSNVDDSSMHFQNIAMMRTNIMRFCPNLFHRGQLEKMFILFADPHFKRSNYRRRVINDSFLAYYAYCMVCLAPGDIQHLTSAAENWRPPLHHHGCSRSVSVDNCQA